MVADEATGRRRVLQMTLKIKIKCSPFFLRKARMNLSFMHKIFLVIHDLLSETSTFTFSFADAV